VQGKKQLDVCIAILALLLISFNLHIWGCAGTGAGKTLTPEQQQALQDSLIRMHKIELAKLWSSGYEPYKQGDYQKAKYYFKQVTEKDTSGIYGKILYQLLGDTFLRLEKPDSAEWAYKIGVQRLPDPYFYKALGYIYKAQSKTDEAIEMYKILIDLEPDSASHYRNLGELYINNDDQNNAILAYQTAVKLDPNDFKSKEILGTLLAKSGDIERVIETQKSLVESYPENTKYRMDLAQTYFDIGEFEKAIEQLKILLPKEPSTVPDIRILEMLGESYQQTNRFNNAVATYNQILQSKPDDKKNLCNLAIAYTSLEKYTTAISQVQKVLRIDPKYGLAYLTMGIIYETSAEKCVARAGGKISFDDKLVYKLAYDEYIQAKNDLEWKREAEKHLNYVQTLIPTKEDYFMHKNQSTPRGACYEWIQ